MIIESARIMLQLTSIVIVKKIFFCFFFCTQSPTGESKGEPAIEENLQEKASGVETVEPFIQVDPEEDDMTTVTAFGVGKRNIKF